jgi:hypothetical protein
MKGSKLLLIFIFLITAGLGAAAVWIGWRLSQEEEVTPEESEAYQRGGGEVVNACGAVCDGNIPSGFMGQTRPGCRCCCIRNQSGWVGKPNECGNDGCVGFDCEGRDCYVMVRTCTASEVSYRADGQGNQCMVCERGPVDTSLGDSLFDSVSYSYYFTTAVHNSRGGNLPNDCLVIQIDLVCQGVSGAADFIVWRGNRWQDTNYCQGTTTTRTTTTTPPTTTTTTTPTTTTTTTTTTPPTTTTTTTGVPECDCESIIRSPSDDTIAAGTDVWFQIEDSCDLTADQVQWFWSQGESGTPQTSNLASRTPLSGPARNHGVVFSVPASATGTLCVWARTEGVDDPDCKECFQIAEVPEAPAFAAVKTSSIECINNNTAARITYTIQVRNVSGVVGVIEYVEDTYDSRFQSSWISNITPTPDSHTGNVIRWDNNDAGYTLQANDGSAGGNDEVEFSYIVTVPSTYFGAYDENGIFVPYEYINHAVVQPQGDEPINLETVVEITCLAPTGILDKALNALLMALMLIMIGFVGLRFQGEFAVLTGKITQFAPLTIVTKATRKFLRNVSYKIENLRSTKKERFERRTISKAEKKDQT